MVRVGGGFMSIEQFVEKHSSIEIFKLKATMAKDKKKLPKLINELIEKFRIKKFTWVIGKQTDLNIYSNGMVLF